MGTTAWRLFLGMSVVALGLAAGHARADATRAARVTTLLSGDLPAELVGPDRAWAPTLSSQVKLQLCAGDRCAAIARVEACAVPRCPGEGALVIAAHAIADVPAFPTDRDGYERERLAMGNDPATSVLYSLSRPHPDPAPVPPPHVDARWLPREGDHWDLELAGSLGLGVVGPDAEPALGGALRLGVLYAWRPERDEDTVVAVFFGSMVGPQLVARGLSLSSGNGGQALSIGIGPAGGYTERGWSVRIPALYLSFVPDFGVIVRDGYKPAFYMGWSLPFSVLVDPRVALEVRLDVLMVDDWVKGDDVGVLATANVGVVLR